MERRIANSLRKKVEELYIQGYRDPEEIATILGCAKETAYRWIKLFERTYVKNELQEIKDMISKIFKRLDKIDSHLRAIKPLKGTASAADVNRNLLI